MKTIIAGSRGITDMGHLELAIARAQHVHYQLVITEVVSGGARGVDKLGEQWAAAHNVPLKVFPADWDAKGKAAGHIRNIEMAEYADALIALWDGESRGTQHMISTARKLGLVVFVAEVKS